MFYRVRVRVELQKVLRESGMSGDPDDCYLTHQINVQGIRNHGIEAKKLNLSIRDAVFYCIEHTIEDFADEDLTTYGDVFNFEKNKSLRSITAATILSDSLNDEYAEKEKPW